MTLLGTLAVTGVAILLAGVAYFLCEYIIPEPWAGEDHE